MPYPASKMIVVRTSRDTLGLLVAASAMVFALAHAVHSRADQAAPPPAAVPAEVPVAQVPQGWAGHLAEIDPMAEPKPSEPMSSATLVVPKSQLALPSVSMRSLVKLRGCQDVPCTPKTNPPAPARRPAVAAVPPPQTATASHGTLLARLNPLNHLPDVSVIGRPFTYAGGAVSDWIKRF